MNKVEHRLLVATELNTEDMLEIFVTLAKKLTWELERVRKEAKEWEGSLHMYRDAWLRELHNELLPKSHEIDALVLTTRLRYAQAKKWESYENRELSRDPFWMVPEFKQDPIEDL